MAVLAIEMLLEQITYLGILRTPIVESRPRISYACHRDTHKVWLVGYS